MTIRRTEGLTTTRLRLRQWRSTDRAVFRTINSDPRVMEFFPSTLTPAESDRLADTAARHIDEHGWGLWAVEVTDTDQFIGFVGLWPAGIGHRLEPMVEVGWRLRAESWGNGYATEAAHAAIEHGFRLIGLDEVVSFTAEINLRSRAVMERLGMTHDPADDFQHPRLPEGHPLRPHVLYRLGASGTDLR